jgi:hypothetical protein
VVESSAGAITTVMGTSRLREITNTIGAFSHS